MAEEPMTSTRLTPEQQSAVLYWPTIAKIPIIPCDDSKTKTFGSYRWKDVDFSQINWQSNVAAGLYDNGIALVLGKTLPGCPYPYCFALDFDGADAVMEFFGSWDSVLSLSKKTRIEWHNDDGRLHIVFFSEKIVTSKRIVIKNGALEVRCDDLLISSPSIHGDGNYWTPLNTDQIAALTGQELPRLQAKIEMLSGKDGYMSDDDKQRYIEWLENPNTIVGEGSRHDAVKILGCSYFYRYSNEWKDLTDDQRRDKVQEWTQQHCNPPFPYSEFSEIWKWIVSTHRKSRDEEHEKLRDAENSGSNNVDPLNMPNCISYQISTNPSIWITGTPDNKLIEVLRKVKLDDGLQIISFLTRKTFTACKPVRITKHKNPLSFLELLQRYTIQFKGSEPSGNFTIKQKTIAEIVAELKNGNALCDNGLDIAINAQIKGFEKNGLLEINDDIKLYRFLF
jgi:hypothetical protein